LLQRSSSSSALHFGTKCNATRQGNGETNKQEIVSITYEEIGFFPRSFSRVLDRFLKQVFSDVENLVIQEYRFYRYLFLTTLKCLVILFFVPFLVNFFAKTYLVRPLTEYFWNTQQTEIFLNSYQQKRAFAELKNFEEKLYFESLIIPSSKTIYHINSPTGISQMPKASGFEQQFLFKLDSLTNVSAFGPARCFASGAYAGGLLQSNSPPASLPVCKPNLGLHPGLEIGHDYVMSSKLSLEAGPTNQLLSNMPQFTSDDKLSSRQVLNFKDKEINQTNRSHTLFFDGTVFQKFLVDKNLNKITTEISQMPQASGKAGLTLLAPLSQLDDLSSNRQIGQIKKENSSTSPSWVPSKQRLQEKTIELAIRYNNQSVEAITNFFADLLSLITLCYLLFALEIQINITKSFLLEVFFGLDDSKKSLLILLITDLLVGYHSSNLWELFFESLFNHYGLPESQTGIFLLVATLPVLLDVLFKYLIFRHLNRSSPATVATYHAMIE
jgi:hypothetical protein